MLYLTSITLDLQAVLQASFLTVRDLGNEVGIRLARLEKLLTIPKCSKRKEE